MWHSTRKLQQQIRIGKDTVLTVLELLPGKVVLKLEAPGVAIDAPVERGRVYDFEVDGQNCQLLLTRVVRGVAFLSLEAPRTVRFQNLEGTPAPGDPVPHE
jgi:sRNA-binding carbon storage regulator CsrA